MDVQRLARDVWQEVGQKVRLLLHHLIELTDPPQRDVRSLKCFPANKPSLFRLLYQADDRFCRNPEVLVTDSRHDAVVVQLRTRSCCLSVITLPTEVHVPVLGHAPPNRVENGERRINLPQVRVEPLTQVYSSGHQNADEHENIADEGPVDRGWEAG